MFEKLMPREVAFFDYFEKQSRTIEEGCLALQDLLENYTDVRQPISTLTVQVFTYAISPYEDWHRQAWAGALVLVTIVLLCSLAARLATRRLERMHARG